MARRPVDRTWAVVSHVSLFLLAIVAPIVILLTVGRDDSSAKHHASEALNAQIWFAIVWNLKLGGVFVSTAASTASSGPALWFFALFPVAALVFLGSRCRRYRERCAPRAERRGGIRCRSGS